MIFFTADLHFCHPFVAATRGYGPKSDNLNKLKRDMGNDEFDYLCNVEAHDAKIVNRINSVVGKKDELYILGDLSKGTGDSLEQALKMLDKLHVPVHNRHLVLGNHENFKVPSSVKYDVYTRFGTVSKFEYLQVPGYYGYNVVMSHLPLRRYMISRYYREDDVAGNAFSRRLAKNSIEVPNNVVHLHGHTHSHNIFDCTCDNSMNVGLDAWGGFPVSWEDVVYEFECEWAR